MLFKYQLIAEATKRIPEFCAKRSNGRFSGTHQLIAETSAARLDEVSLAGLHERCGLEQKVPFPVHEDGVVPGHREETFIVCYKAVAAAARREHIRALSIREDGRVGCDEEHQRVSIPDAEVVTDERDGRVRRYRVREQKVEDEVEEHNAHCLL